VYLAAQSWDGRVEPPHADEARHVTS